MRAEGVLRLILNVSLFPGMQVELAQDKFVRFVGLEDGQLIHFALKVSNPAAGTGLFRAIKAQIPPKDQPAKKQTGYVMREEAAAPEAWDDAGEAA